MEKTSDNLIQEIVKLRKEGKSLKKISLELKIGIATVSKYIDFFGLKNKSSSYINEETKNKIIETYKILKDVTLTHQEYNNISRVTIYSIIKNSGFYHIPPILSKEEWKKRRSESVKKWKKEAKRKLVEYKGGKCQICNYNRSLRALEFHHLDPTKKDFEISNNSLSFDVIKLEVDKCALLCANCHREYHDGLINLNILTLP